MSIRSKTFGCLGFACITISLIHTAFGQLDFDNDGLSDLWTEVYKAQNLSADADTDGDGYSNRFESKIGSDPFDPESYFGLNSYRFEADNTLLIFDFQTIKGVRYFIESAGKIGPEAVWRTDTVVDSNDNGSQIIEQVIDRDSDSTRFFRVRQVIDEDRDGLTSWEEWQLGLDDQDSLSNGGEDSDFHWAVDRHLTGLDLELRDSIVKVVFGLNIEVREPVVFKGVDRTPEEVSRFLNQATFGPTFDMIQDFHNSGESFAAWIDSQIAMSPTLITESMERELMGGASRNHQLFHRGWWRATAKGADQLRQRMAFALSQILVVSGQGSDVVRGSPEAAGAYYEILQNQAFGNYADLLEAITYNLGMGSYLGHLRNQSEDPELRIFPDENYARELMQLFSIGLWELNEDGSRRRDYIGNPIPTYTNFHITELAKVMTGFNWGGTNSFYEYKNRPDLPMTIWETHHERGEKFLVNGGYLPAEMEPAHDVRLAIENLVNHPSAGPFIGRLLIQRFTTSNPSPAYIRRVARAFSDNGKGIRGDLGAVIRSILLDPEARSQSISRGERYGKMREPYLTYAHLSRAFSSKNADDVFYILTDDHLDYFGQRPLMSPTVFNFYSPNYQPADEAGEGDFFAPEFEILTPLRSVLWPNLLRKNIELGFAYSPDFTHLTRDHDFKIERALVNHPENLVDRLDLIFTYGTLKQETRQIILNMMNDAGLDSDEKKLWTAIYAVMTSPEYVILR
ncbi:DUF1800 family protein [Akkermansiaceae bacterium]|nr:DUF1800 family protein [Akkermansiaceae bacterium]MDB4407586.1 DUF1800 family protein [Akkermansiaceae bacterium]